MAEATEVAAAPAKKSGKSLILVLLLGCLGGGGAVGWVLWHRAPAAAHPVEPPAPKVKSVLHLEDFVVNLADPESRAYVRLGVDLGQSEATAAKEGEKEAGPNPIPAIRDTILGVVAGYKSDDLLTSEGKAKLKHDLLAALQQRAPEAHVLEVYFTEFLVQR